MRRTVSLILTLALVFLLFSPVSALTHPPIYVSGADAYVLIDAKSGTVLASYEGDKKIYPASTTKILTAIVALEKGSLDMKMTASVAAVHDIGKDGMNIGIQAGEVMTMEDLLNAMLVVSANETANIIAENICETRQEFMDLCNQKAAEIGATDTHYTNPCGMHEDSHYTTAMDLAKIARHAMQNEVFRSIVRKTSIQLSPTNKHSSWNTLYTSNILLRSNNFEGYEITGIKSGYTDPAGRCLITSARNHAGEELIAVVMGVRAPNSGEVITDITTKLFEYGFNNFKSLNLVRKNVYLGLHSVENARDNMPLVLVAQEDLDVFTLASIAGQYDTGVVNVYSLDRSSVQIYHELGIRSVPSFLVGHDIDGQRFSFVLFGNADFELEPRMGVSFRPRGAVLVHLPGNRRIRCLLYILVPAFRIIDRIYIRQFHDRKIFKVPTRFTDFFFNEIHGRYVLLKRQRE
jgi:D-alanyl-D-alanine carboxypeptidase (penicillin-binding protein 5/6)